MRRATGRRSIRPHCHAPARSIIRRRQSRLPWRIWLVAHPRIRWKRSRHRALGSHIQDIHSARRDIRRHNLLRLEAGLPPIAVEGELDRVRMAKSNAERAFDAVVRKSHGATLAPTASSGASMASRTAPGRENGVDEITHMNALWRRDRFERVSMDGRKLSDSDDRLGSVADMKLSHHIV